MSTKDIELWSLIIINIVVIKLIIHVVVYSELNKHNYQTLSFYKILVSRVAM